jgi:arylsulfatase A-like enzyme
MRFFSAGRCSFAMLLLLGCAVLLAGCAADQQAAAPPASLQSRPNIVLLLADDMGYSDLGCYGSNLRTPHLDQLGTDGLRFTQFYNASRCCPSRASLLTGLYPHQAGIGLMTGRSANYPGDLSHTAVTLAEALSSAGYATYMTGKWHVTPWRPNAPGATQNLPTMRGFDGFYGIIQSIRSHYSAPSLMENQTVLPTPQGDYHFTDAVTEHALTSLQQQKTDRPYFMYVAYAAPHFPLHARESDIAHFRGQFTAGWDVLKKQRYQKMVDMKLLDPAWQLPPRDPQELPWEDVKPEYRAWFDQRMAVYAAMIEQMDRGIGQIIAAIRARPDRDNTLVLFLSDNGGCAEEIGPNGTTATDFPRQTRSGQRVRVGNDPSIIPGPEDTYASYGLEWAGLSNTPFRRFKSFVHEGGIATPLIAWWPGHIAPGMTPEIGHVIDVMPTLLELAKGAYPAQYKGNQIVPLEGHSLVPVLQGGTRPEAVFVWEHEGNRALRLGDWKLVSRLPQAWELYDMKKDRIETHDLARNMPDKVAELAALYQKEALRTGIKPWIGAQTPIGWQDNSKWKK